MIRTAVFAFYIYIYTELEKFMKDLYQIRATLKSLLNLTTYPNLT